MRIRIGLVMLVAAIGAASLTALHIATPLEASPARGAGVCGGDRLYIRTLQDRPDLLPAKKTTLVKLTSIPRPKSLPANRLLPIEHQVFTVVADPALLYRDPNLDLRTILVKGGTPRYRWVSAGVPSPHATVGRSRIGAGRCGSSGRR